MKKPSTKMVMTNGARLIEVENRMSPLIPWIV
jgi:hypothetical protein